MNFLCFLVSCGADCAYRNLESVEAPKTCRLRAYEDSFNSFSL